MSVDLPPVIHPGQTLRGVPHVKRLIYNWIMNKGNASAKALASRMDRNSDTYGGVAVRCVKYVQRQIGIRDDGIVGRRTYDLLGVNPRQIMPTSLRGIPWEPGLRPMDGNWVTEAHWRRLNTAKSRGWRGPVNSGYRPDWYQARLFKAAVIEYGSEAAASKWVARPGRSNHRFKNDRLAVDTGDATTLRKVMRRWYQPMSWEPWHSQWRPAYGLSIQKLIGIFRKDSPPDLVEPPDLDEYQVSKGIEQELQFLRSRSDQ